MYKECIDNNSNIRKEGREKQHYKGRENENAQSGFWSRNRVIHCHIMPSIPFDFKSNKIMSNRLGSLLPFSVNQSQIV